MNAQGKTNLALTAMPEGSVRNPCRCVVEGFDAGAWIPAPSACTYQTEAEQRLRARFPAIPMQRAVEATAYTVAHTASGQTPPVEGDQVT